MSQYKLSDHMRSHTKERVIACPTCGSTFATKTKFCDHRRRQLPIECKTFVPQSACASKLSRFSTKLSMFSVLKTISYRAITKGPYESTCEPL